MNFSKPRNSTMCSRACWTRLFASSSSVTLPWPSTRLTGSMTTRRRFSGLGAVSRAWVMLSVVVERLATEPRFAAGQEVGEELPEGVGGRRAAGQVVVDVDDLVDRAHLV